jgi:DNA-binding transcriptional ArsR family regulator
MVKAMNVKTLLATAEKDYAAKRAALDAEFTKKRGELLAQVQVKFADAMKAAAALYAELPEGFKEDVYTSDALTSVLNTLGLRAGKAKKARKAGKATPKVEDASILAYLDTEKQTSDIAAHVKLSKLTIGKRLADLLKANKVTVRKDGTAKLWKRA